MLPFLLVVVFPFVAAQCPYAYSPLNGGTLCSSTTFCQALGGSGYQCMNGQCCRINGLCNVDEISVGYDCFKISYEGGRCVHSTQCQPQNGLRCVNGICSRTSADEGVRCSNPAHQVERQNGALKNCMYGACSVGFGCEYSVLANQYVCCGNYNANNDYTYGKVRMYPGTSNPLKCYGSSDCLFDDTPNCINSQRYGHFVCCSTFNC